MTETEKAYLAGIIDGEGSIMLIRLSKTTHPAPVLSVPSTTIELLHYIQKIIGFGKIIPKTNYNKEKHKDCYTFTLIRNQALDVIKEIYPYLIINTKRERARLLLTDYKRLTPRNGRYSPELLTEKEDFYKLFISVK